MDTLFDEIITNPAEWDPSGLLKVRRRVDPAGPQHACRVGCSPNMCKGELAGKRCLRSQQSDRIDAGEELDAFINKHQPAFDRIIYVGDGSNDFCPILRLRRCVHSVRLIPTNDADVCNAVKTSSTVGHIVVSKVAYRKKGRPLVCSAKCSTGVARGKSKSCLPSCELPTIPNSV